MNEVISEFYILLLVSSCVIVTYINVVINNDL